MFKKILTLIFLLSSLTLVAQQKNIVMNVQEASLQEVILILETQYGFLFSYKEEDIKDVQISIKTGKSDIQHFLKTILSDKDLDFEIVDANYIILKRKNPVGGDINEPSSKEQDYFLFCGTVIDSLTKKPLAFANIYLRQSKTGSYSYESGFFKFQSELINGDELVISYVGYEEKRLVATDFINGDCPTVALNYKDYGEEFVIVTDYLTDGIDLGDNGASTVIRPNRIGVLPGQVEPDILNTIQFLPGISSPDGAASSIYIRGGSADQNLILWEDIPIYHSAHYFGMISAFNPYIIDKAEVYRGGFGAEYGGRVSGLIDLKSENHNIVDPGFGIGANFINGYLYGKHSFWNKKASIIYSARRSMTELWRSPLFENMTLRNLQGILVGNFKIDDLPPDLDISDDFNFFDTHAKLAVHASEKDDLSIAWFLGNNNFQDSIYHDNRKQVQKDILSLKNQGMSISWKHQWNEDVSSKVTAVSTNYDQDYKYAIRVLEGNAPDKFGVKNNKICEKQIHYSNSIKTKNQQIINVGYQLTNYDIAYQVTQESNDVPLANERDSVKTNLHVVYTTFSTSKDKKIGLKIGLRWNYYGKKNNSYFEPRAKLWYKVSDDLSLHLNAGQYYQFLSQLIEFKGDNAGIDTPIWVLTGDGDNPVLNAKQYQIGLLYNKNAWVIDLQAYHKKIKGLTSLSTGFDLMPKNPDLGDAYIKGIDLLVKKRWKNYRTWVSYSLSKADYEFKTFFDKIFPAPYDQRHVLSWANMFTFGNFECSIGWKINSGNPYSFMDRFETDPGPMGRVNFRPIYEEFYSKRLVAQHQLDASVLYHIRPSSDKWEGVIGLSLFNIYKKQNAYSREYYIDTGPNRPPKIKFVDKTTMGFSPNMVIRFEW